MAQEIQEERIITRSNDVHEPVTPTASVIVGRVLYTLYGILIGLLTLRIILSLLGANRSNAFADAIYSVTQPFVAPFVGLFNVDQTFGRVRLEFETLFAIVIYTLILWVILRVLTLGNRSPEV